MIPIQRLLLRPLFEMGPLIITSIPVSIGRQAHLYEMRELTGTLATLAMDPASLQPSAYPSLQPPSASFSLPSQQASKQVLASHLIVNKSAQLGGSNITLL